MTYIRIRWQKLGGHIHCRMFTTQTKDGTFAKNGEVVFDEREWPEVKAKLSGAVEFVADK